MLTLSLTALAIWIATIAGAPQPPACRISAYVSDPANATAGIQAALRDCGAVGGTVLFDRRGIYVAGGLVATGSVQILILPGTTLAASNSQADYPGPKPDWYLLRLSRCSRCAVGGGGTIDGRGAAWVTARGPERATLRVFNHPSCDGNPVECRPRLLGVLDSADITVRSLTIIDPVYWSVHVLASTNVTLSDLRITGDWDIPNTDGVDIDSSADVTLSAAWIDVADDAVCVKTTRPGVPAVRIAVRNCTLRSRSAAFKIGSETVADVAHVAAADLVVREAGRGLAVQLRDGGSVRHVSFSRIQLLAVKHSAPSWWGAAEAASLTAQPRAAAGAPVGDIEGITFDEIAATAENGIVVAGAAAGGSVRSVAVRGFRLDLVRYTDWPGGRQDYRPGYRGVVDSGGVAAVWVEHASGVAFEGVTVVEHAPRRPDWRETVHIEADSVQDVSFADCQFSNATAGAGVSETHNILMLGDPRRLIA